MRSMYITADMSMHACMRLDISAVMLHVPQAHVFAEFRDEISPKGLCIRVV